MKHCYDPARDEHHWIDQNGQYWVTSTSPSGGSAYPTGTTHVGTFLPGFTLGARAGQDTISHPAIENAGIRTGEIIGYRAWKLDGGKLRSIIWSYYEWEPGAVERCENPMPDYYGHGIHAYKDIQQAQDEWPGYGIRDIVYGSIAMWGNVIEHQHGYRSEFAKILSLDHISSDRGPFGKALLGSKLDNLRKKYLK